MHVVRELYIEDIPVTVIKAISSITAKADDIVDAYRQDLDFTVDPDNARAYIKGYGCYDDQELANMTNNDLANWVLWEACNSFQEQLDWNRENPDLDPSESSVGTDLICLEG